MLLSSSLRIFLFKPDDALLKMAQSIFTNCRVLLFESDEIESVEFNINHYQKLEKICEHYIKKGCCFKKCFDDINNEPYIVVLEHVEYNINNENRDNIIDFNFASFRANKMQPIDIISLNDLNSHDSIVSYFSDENLAETYMTRDGYWDQTIEPKNGLKHKTTYDTKQIVKPDSYDDNRQIVFGHGIHYFKSLQAAYLYGLHRDEKEPHIHHKFVHYFDRNGGKLKDLSIF